MNDEFRNDDLIHFAEHGARTLPAAGDQGYVEHESADLWYGGYGDGPAVILLHGAFDNSEDWGYQIAALVGAGYRAIAIDNRGRGRSSLGSQPLTYALLADEVLAVMDALQLDRAVIVGWSDGAIIALTLAMTHPARVTGVFAFGALMHLSGLKELDPADARLARVFGRAKKDFTRLSPTPDAFAATAKAVDRMTGSEPNHTAEELAAIRAPVAVVVGEFDEFVMREHTDWLMRCIADAERIVLPQVSHFALLQRPADFNRAMLAFVRRVLR